MSSEVSYPSSKTQVEINSEKSQEPRSIVKENQSNVGKSSGKIQARSSISLQLSPRLMSIEDSHIRVRIASNLTGLTIAASTSALVMTSERKAVARLEPNLSYRAVMKPSGVQLGNVQLARAMWIDPGQDGFVFVNGSWYRGRILIANIGHSLIAVNWVNLEHYLYSVVGSEMPSRWNLEALKAQAIAARSYALIHIRRPASPWFDLGNDERWQAYKGVYAEATNTYTAVAATTGQILVKNGQILEALYASTQAITNSAHAGFGMSQYGAQALAAKGHNYLQILARYYPKSMIAQLQYHL